MYGSENPTLSDGQPNPHLIYKCYLTRETLLYHNDNKKKFNYKLLFINILALKFILMHYPSKSKIIKGNRINNFIHLLTCLQ